MAEEQRKKPQEKGPKKSMNFYWIYALIGVVLIAMFMFQRTVTGKVITLNDFEKMVEQEYVAEVNVQEQFAEITLSAKGFEAKRNELGEGDGGMMNTVGPEGPHYRLNIDTHEVVVPRIAELKGDDNFALSFEPPADEFQRQIMTWIIILGIMIAAWVIIMRRLGSGGGAGGQIFSIGKSKAKLFEKGKGTDVTFKDVAGLEGAKEEIVEIVEFLKEPKKYTKLGAKIPKGALLIGAPGTGKTLLAKAVAGEAQVPFFSLSGSDFVEMFVGVGASRVRDLFRQAKEKAPAIIFIDEIDAIGRARGKNVNMGSNDERENTLNQLLTEMDGFGTNSGVIILAATNRADILDKALLRAGRFDRQIFVDMPDLRERKAIFKVHLKPIKIDKTVDIDFLARQTPGFSGADIANICNESALIAARSNKESVEMQDFLDAVDRVVGGLEKKNKIIAPEEKERVAVHESGHAMVSWKLEHASPLVKVTIVPRGQSLGAAWYLPEERQLTTTQQILDEICAALGGRAAEEVIYGDISTGALSDLEKVTKQAYAMVTVYGLNDKIGNRSYYDPQGDSSFMKPYSEDTAKIIDEEVSKILESAYERAKKILRKDTPKLKKLAEKLLEKEVIFKEDLKTILGERDFDSKGKMVFDIPNNGSKVPEEELKSEADEDVNIPDEQPKEGTEETDSSKNDDKGEEPESAAEEKKQDS